MATKKPNPKSVRAANTKKSSSFSINPVVAIALLVITFIVTRYWAAGAGLKWHSYIFGKGDLLYGDVATYDYWGFNMLQGIFPFSSGISQNELWTNDAWQYPALAALVFMLGYKIHAGLVGFVQLAVLADFALLALLIWAGRERKDQNGNVLSSANFIPAAIWVSTPIFVGPLLLGRFDVFPTLAIVAALLATTSARRFGIWTSVGALLKVWPVLAFLAISRKQFKEAFLWFAGATVLISAALYLWWPQSISVFLKGQTRRGLQIESIGALPYMMFGQENNTKAIEFKYGAWQVTGANTEIVSLLMTLIFIALIGIIAWWRVQGRLEAISRFDIALLVVLISMVTSRVLSPQYSVWVFGLLAVAAFTPQRRFWLIAGLLATSVLFGQILFPGKYSDFQLLLTEGVMIQTVRVVCLLAATILCWKNVTDRLIPASKSDSDDTQTASVASAPESAAKRQVSFNAKGKK